jgi:hypothetical protein
MTRRAPMTEAGIAIITSAGRDGATQQDIRLALGKSGNATCSAIIDWREKGLIYSAGTRMLMRHFIRKEWADDWNRICLQVRDRRREEIKARNRERERERRKAWALENREHILEQQRLRYQKHKDELKARRDAKAAAKAAERAKKQGMTPAEWVGTVRKEKPPKITFKNQEAIVPPHVMVQVCPGFERFGTPFHARCKLDK